MDQDTALFLHWLKEHGAAYHKIDWPSYETQSGMRGAIAKENIATMENILEIPYNIMITPLHAHRDPYIGQELLACSNLLQGDLLLTIFVMYEKSKGIKSFWYPYMQILPKPYPATSWTMDQIAELQSQGFRSKIMSRNVYVKNMYKRSILEVNKLYPEKFPLEVFTYELFEFAWNTISARAFGRRLPWSALVPLADCLNHANVQTKYDYDINGNQLFRLFPTGNNSYTLGKEVFNSYGRRNNDNLLLDYGFAMLDNEWDYVEIVITVDSCRKLLSGDDKDAVPPVDERLRVLLALGYSSFHHFHVTWKDFPWKLLPFLRVLVATGDEIDQFWNHTETTYVAMNEENVGDDEDLVIQSSNLIFIKPISVRNEHASFQLLCRILQDQLDLYPTTITQDEDTYHSLLSSNSFIPELDEDAKGALLSAVVYRLTKKHLQQHLLTTSESICQLLSNETNSTEAYRLDILSSLFNIEAMDVSIEGFDNNNDDEHLIRSSSKREIQKAIQERERIQEFITALCSLT